MDYKVHTTTLLSPDCICNILSSCSVERLLSFSNSRCFSISNKTSIFFIFRCKYTNKRETSQDFGKKICRIRGKCCTFTQQMSTLMVPRIKSAPLCHLVADILYYLGIGKGVSVIPL